MMSSEPVRSLAAKSTRSTTGGTQQEAEARHAGHTGAALFSQRSAKLLQEDLHAVEMAAVSWFARVSLGQSRLEDNPSLKICKCDF